MATTFPEKQRWVGTLEALVDHSDTDKRQEAVSTAIWEIQTCLTQCPLVMNV